MSDVTKKFKEKKRLFVDAREAEYREMKRQFYRKKYNSMNIQPKYSPITQLKIRVIKMYLEKTNSDLDDEELCKETEKLVTKLRPQSEEIIKQCVQLYPEEVKRIKDEFQAENPHLVDSKGNRLSDEWIKIPENKKIIEDEER